MTLIMPSGPGRPRAAMAESSAPAGGGGGGGGSKVKFLQTSVNLS